MRITNEVKNNQYDNNNMENTMTNEVNNKEDDYSAEDKISFASAKYWTPIINDFCDKTNTLSSIHSPYDQSMRNKVSALIDISFVEERLQDLEDIIIDPINKIYKENGGTANYYMSIQSLIEECFQRGLESFSSNPDAIEEFITEEKKGAIEVAEFDKRESA